jgi:hypothetical protein
MAKHKKTVVFEDDTEYHITKEETFDVAFAMFQTLQKTCPGCAMGVLSMLISMLAIDYMKDAEKLGKIFDHADWIKYVINGADTAINRFEHKDTSVN